MAAGTIIKSGMKRMGETVLSTATSTHYVEGEKPLKEIKNKAQVAAESVTRKTKLKLRKKIKPIADPELDKSERRKRAAKRRKTGRLGTVLSGDTETLG